jgi:hypothetical protein
VVIPKSVTPSRIAENFNVWDFRLDKDELSEITNWTRTTQGQTGSVRRLTFLRRLPAEHRFAIRLKPRTFRVYCNQMDAC